VSPQLPKMAPFEIQKYRLGFRLPILAKVPFPFFILNFFVAFVFLVTSCFCYFGAHSYY
jgi:hypothetical protein